MIKKLKVGDIVEIKWRKDLSLMWKNLFFNCPICGNKLFYQFDYCKKCKSVFKRVHCIEIVEIGGKNE